MSSSPPHNISPRVLDLLSVDRNPRQQLDAGTLTDAEIATLEAIIDRRIVPPGPFSLGKALAALARKKQTPDVARRLGTVLADPSVDTTDRMIAATQLGLIAGREAERVLIAQLDVPDRLVQLEAIRSLGMIGDERALARLDALPVPRSEAGRKQLAFAKSLIAHRLGLARDDLPFREGEVRQRGTDEEMIQLTLRVLDTDAMRRDRQRLDGSTYGIEPGDLGFDLRAGDARWTVFVNEALTAGWGFSRLFERPWITALLGRWHERTQVAATQYVVLTTPRDGSAAIMVVRRDGELFYTGSLAAGEGRLAFEVRDVARAGTAPTNVQGNLTPEGIELTLSVPFGQRRDPKPGQPIEVR